MIARPISRYNDALYPITLYRDLSLFLGRKGINVISIGITRSQGKVHVLFLEIGGGLTT